MTDQKLADKIVALGVGQIDPHQMNHIVRYLPYYPPYETSGQWCEADEFVRDWRVAGALMEKMPDLVITPLKGGYWVEPPLAKDAVQNDSLPRAIIEACVEALDD